MEARKAALARELDEARVARRKAEVEEAARVRQVAEAERTRREAAWEADRGARLSAEVEELDAAAAALAARSVRGLLDRVGGPDLDLALCRSGLAALPPEPGRPIVAELARPPDAALRAALETALREGVEVRVVPDLGAGVRLLTRGGVVDASARGIASEAARAVKEALSVGTGG